MEGATEFLDQEQKLRLILELANELRGSEAPMIQHVAAQIAAETEGLLLMFALSSESGSLLQMEGINHEQP